MEIADLQKKLVEESPIQNPIELNRPGVISIGRV